MLLQIQKLTKSYTNANHTIKRNVLQDLDFEIDKGEKIAIVGDSGSGKTTLLNLIALFDKPDSGTIRFKNQECTHFTEIQINHFRNKEIGFVFQKHHLLPQCTLWENILLPALVSGEKPEKYEARAEMLMNTLGVSNLRNQKPGELSGGECQRTAVIRALINEPALLLADEPTGSLDEENATELMKLLSDLNDKTGVALILVTHAEKIAQQTDKIYKLKSGSLSAQASN